MKFMDVPVNIEFRGAKSNGLGVNSNVSMWMEYKKLDSSTAICVKQVGYANSRSVGRKTKFSSNAQVWIDPKYDKGDSWAYLKGRVMFHLIECGDDWLSINPAAQILMDERGLTIVQAYEYLNGLTHS